MTSKDNNSAIRKLAKADKTFKALAQELEQLTSNTLVPIANELHRVGERLHIMSKLAEEQLRAVGYPGAPIPLEQSPLVTPYREELSKMVWRLNQLYFTVYNCASPHYFEKKSHYIDLYANRLAKIKDKMISIMGPTEAKQ